MRRLLLIFSIFVLIFLCSCNPFDNSSKPSEVIDAVSSIGVGRINLKLSVERYIPAGDYCYFTTNKTLSQIRDELEIKNNECRFQLLNDSILVEQKIKDKIIFYGIFSRNNEFIFLPLEIHIKEVEASNKYHKIFAPFHYSEVMKEAALGLSENNHFPLEMDWYPIECDEKEYKKFYEDSHLFIIQEFENTYNLKIKELEKNFYESSLHFNTWFSIAFKVEENQTYVRYTLLTE